MGLAGGASISPPSGTSGSGAGSASGESNALGSSSSRVVAVPNGKWCYRFANAQLNLHGPDGIGHPRAKEPVMPGNSDLCFEWDGPIADAVAHLQAHDVAIELGPVSRFGRGGKGASVYFRDPDGSLLEFISYRDNG